MNTIITNDDARINLLPDEIISWSYVLNQNINSSVCHYYYTVADIREEIHKRSSYIGKFRSTEQAAHLLDLIAMTSDEEDIFKSFLQASAADVFDSLVKYTAGVDEAYSVGDDPNEEVEEGETKSNNVNFYVLRKDTLTTNMVKPLDNAIFEALVNRIIYKWLILSFPSEADVYLALYAEAEQKIKERAATRNSYVSEIVPRPY